jgi:hypothetical protein
MTSLRVKQLLQASYAKVNHRSSAIPQIQEAFESKLLPHHDLFLEISKDISNIRSRDLPSLFYASRRLQLNVNPLLPQIAMLQNEIHAADLVRILHSINPLSSQEDEFFEFLMDSLDQKLKKTRHFLHYDILAETLFTSSAKNNLKFQSLIERSVKIDLKSGSKDVAKKLVYPILGNLLSLSTTRSALTALKSLEDQSTLNDLCLWKLKYFDPDVFRNLNIDYPSKSTAQPSFKSLPSSFDVGLLSKSKTNEIQKILRTSHVPFRSMHYSPFTLRTVIFKKQAPVTAIEPSLSEHEIKFCQPSLLKLRGLRDQFLQEQHGIVVKYVFPADPDFISKSL